MILTSMKFDSPAIFHICTSTYKFVSFSHIKPQDHFHCWQLTNITYDQGHGAMVESGTSDLEVRGSIPGHVMVEFFGKICPWCL